MVVRLGAGYFWASARRKAEAVHERQRTARPQQQCDCRKRPAHLCPGQDLNLHALRRYHLKVVRLPISPPGRITKIQYSRYFFNSLLFFNTNRLVTELFKESASVAARLYTK